MSSKPTSLKAKSTGTEPLTSGAATLAYVAPFAIFVAMLALRRLVPLPPEQIYLLRLGLVLGALLLFSRGVVPRERPAFLLGSLALGALVFVIWILPDALWPRYREFWLFHNPITGAAQSTLPVRLKSGVLFMVLRVLESTVLVPVVEELFWRGWLMRWLIRPEFQKVPLGAFTPFSFWCVALLFASEHGPYWEVGLIAGAAYNWWIVRTRNLADCIVAHAFTNALLAGFVLFFDQWQYWL